MSMIAGFLGTLPRDDSAASRLARMLSTAGGVGGTRTQQAVQPSGAVAARGDDAASAVAVDGLCVAISGRPRWQDTRLDRLAAERGMAASVAEAYRERGERFLDALLGTFAVAVVEPATGTCLLAIDRVGAGTLAYAPTREGVVFASRADAVALHPQVAAPIDSQAVFDYLFFHAVPAPETIFRGVQKLLPGQVVAIRRGNAEARFYWALRYHDRSGEDTASLEARFRALLPEVVGRAAVPGTVGTFLSGGTDSSTVTGILAEVTGAPVDSYSVGFDADGFDEMAYARAAAQRFAVRHRVLYMTPADVVSAVPVIAAAYDEPFGNASAAPTFHCAKAARADGKDVLLAGDGGDELFGGNARYAKQKLFEAYALVPGPLRGALEGSLLRSVALARIPPVRKLQSYVQQAQVPLPDRLESYNFLLRESVTGVLAPEFLRAVDATRPFELMREVYARTASESAVNRMMHLDLKHTLADSDLRKVGTMCRAAGVEVRYPLLDDAMVTFSGEVPPSLHVRGLKLRHFFKRALRDFLPPEIIAKSKHGFGLPFGVWMARHEPLRELAMDSLARFKTRGIVQPAYVDALVARCVGDHATYYGVMVWVMMILEQWLRHHDAARRERTPSLVAG